MTRTPRRLALPRRSPSASASLRLRLPLICLLALMAPPLTGSAETAEADWAVAETAHFHLYTDAGPEVAERAAGDLLRLRGALAEIAPRGRFDDVLPMNLYLFGDLRLFLREEMTKDFSPWTAGFLVPTEHGVYGGAQWAEKGESSRFLYKQYLLWVLKENLPQLPDWLTQGLAEYYGTFRVVDGTAHIGLPVREHVFYLTGLNDTLLIVGDDGPTGSKPAENFHPVAWALVHYLLLGDEELRPKVAPYVRRVVVDGADPEVAFTETFGTSRAEIVGRLRDYALRDRFKYVQRPLAELVTPEVEVSRLGEADVAYHLGDLLAHALPERRAEAAERFRQALTLDPEHARAAAGLGVLAEQNGDLDAALTAYAGAVAKRPDDVRLQLLYGDALLTSLGPGRPSGEEELSTLATATAALRRASELEPDLAFAWERLGYALNLTARGDAEAVVALERARSLLPRRHDVALNLLLAYARIGDVTGADALIEDLPRQGASPETLDRAHQVRLQLALQEANLLLRRGALDDAVAVLAQVRAEATDPRLVELAAAQLELAVWAAQHNRFAELYGEASRQVAAGDPAAGETIERLSAAAKAGRQEKAVMALQERWRKVGEEAKGGP